MTLSRSGRASLFKPVDVLPNKQPCTWFEIDFAAFQANVATIRSLLRPGVQLGSMTKGNAYGLGFIEFIAMSHAYVDIYYVMDVDEAMHIRKFEALHQLKPKRIVLHGFHYEEFELHLCVLHDFEFFLDHVDHHAMIQATNLTSRLKVHIFMDSGLNREGFKLEKIPTAVEQIKKYKDKIDILGVLTHLRAGSNAESNKQQIDDYTIAYDFIRKELSPEKYLEKSIGNSAASLSFPSIEQDITRLGLALIHGLWPAPETEHNVKLNISPKEAQLLPVLSWKCKTHKIRCYEAGVDLVTELNVGFQRKLTKPTTVATLPLGSKQGYLTVNTAILAEERPYVLVKGQRCKVLLIELETIAIDVTNVARPGENIVVTLIGQDKNITLGANQPTSWFSNSPNDAYSFLTCLSGEIPRFIVNQPIAKELELSRPRL
jgi:alanine racemase